MGSLWRPESSWRSAYLSEACSGPGARQDSDALFGESADRRVVNTADSIEGCLALSDCWIWGSKWSRREASGSLADLFWAGSAVRTRSNRTVNNAYFIFISSFVCPLAWRHFSFCRQSQPTFDRKFIAVNSFEECQTLQNSNLASCVPHSWPRACLWSLPSRSTPDESQSARSCCHQEFRPRQG